MVAKTVKGSRVVVELPWKGVTNNKEQYVRIKKPVAELLKFTIKDTSDLTYNTQVNKKDSADSKNPGKETVKRIVRPGYRQRSLTVVFSSEKSLSGNSKRFKSVSFPVTPSVAVLDVVKYFETGAGKSLGVVKVITDKGASYSINN